MTRKKESSAWLNSSIDTHRGLRLASWLRWRACAWRKPDEVSRSSVWRPRIRGRLLLCRRLLGDAFPMFSVVLGGRLFRLMAFGELFRCFSPFAGGFSAQPSSSDRRGRRRLLRLFFHAALGKPILRVRIDRKDQLADIRRKRIGEVIGRQLVQQRPEFDPLVLRE